MREVRPGVWQFRVYDPHSPEPRQVRKTFYGNKTKATRALADFSKEVRDGGLVASGCTLGEHIDRWLEFCEPRLAGKTYLGYRSKLSHVKETLGHLPLERFNLTGGQLLDRTYERWLKEGQTAANVRGIHQVLRNCLHQAQRWNLLDTIATDRATPPKYTRPPIRDIDPALVIQAVERAQRSRAPHLAVALLFNSVTGVRAGELCAICWPDFDPEVGVVRIDKAVKQDSKGRWIVGPTKTGQMRNIPLEPEIVQILLAWRLEAERINQKAGTTLTPDAFIFSPHPRGHQFWTAQGYSQAVRRLNVDLTQLEVRHFTATHLIASGLDVVTVAGVMGHHPTVTLSNYAAWQQSGARRAARAIAGVVFNPASLPPPRAS